MKYLLSSDYEVEEAKTCREAEALFRQKTVDLCILDINLEDGSGYEVCRRLRRHSAVPILFVTVRDDEESIIKGLEVGGDDYVTKPFSSRQLLARVKALLRRSYSYKKRECKYLYSGDYVFDLNNRIIYKNSEEMPLSPTELQMAELLMLNYGCLISRERMLEKIWDSRGNFVENNTLTVNISRLRKKLGEFEGVPYIRTMKGIGYRWDVPVTGGQK